MDPYNNLVDFIDMFQPIPLKGYQRKFVEEMDKKNKCAVTTANGLTGITTNWFELAPLPKAVPIPPPQELCEIVNPRGELVEYVWKTKQEGKTPMRYNDNYASASANVTTIQSDTAIQRDYLLSRLAKADYPKENELRNLFNIYVDNTPRTYKELIDAIKNDKFTIDKKVEKKLKVDEENDEKDDFYFGGPFNGIIWSGPQPDPVGFKKAYEEKGKQYTAAKDIIMTGDAAAGLKALQDFEAWLPTPAAIAS